MRVRPASNPKKNESVVAHFLKSEATSSFTIRRYGNVVTASVHGRNEVSNTETDNLFDKARNTMVALGAFIGLSKVQWRRLVKGLLENDDPSMKAVA